MCWRFEKLNANTASVAGNHKKHNNYFEYFIVSQQLKKKTFNNFSNNWGYTSVVLVVDK